ncbi:fructose-bisphosphate aldolase [Lindgomyces ingoldianus]|uniref:Fructose-bisphosphate aldolase n=1 Tax=Lindgomyces ingoldianus TaxID=673940 RepID=A0ACB6QZY2_9PLEO|nr:fructose-bisphosphate aldolase [Lindgomyces ingoldianus]KAF2472486.1 fructose-bisphosphate aldolase [Lindgomyces ingoldianus]
MQPNRTLQILNKAAREKYGVLAAIAYNIEQLTALVRAAESKRSPLILQLFPSTLKQLPTLAHAAAVAVNSATVPISLHIDHAQDEVHIREILTTLPVDSIMVDMSHYEKEENLEKTRVLAKECHERGIAVEAESGRINGGEDGIAGTGNLEALFTTPEDVEDFIKAEIDILAPSIGNIHGDYGPQGPALGQIHFDRLESINKQTNDRVLVCLHGTNDFTAEIMKRCIENGAIKLNVNKLLLEVWNEFLRQNASKMPLVKLIDMGIEILQKETERWMDICGSSGMA